jgi:transposase
MDFTIIEACRNRGIDPQSYLREVFTRLPTLTTGQIKDITTEAWSKAQKATPQRKAA